MVQFQMNNRNGALIAMARIGHNVMSLSEAVGISESYMSQVLSGRRNPSTKLAHKIASELGLDVEEVFDISATVHAN